MDATVVALTTGLFGGVLGSLATSWAQFALWRGQRDEDRRRSLLAVRASSIESVIDATMGAMHSELLRSDLGTPEAEAVMRRVNADLFKARSRLIANVQDEELRAKGVELIDAGRMLMANTLTAHQGIESGLEVSSDLALADHDLRVKVIGLLEEFSNAVRDARV